MFPSGGRPNLSFGFVSSNYDGDMLQVYNNLLSSFTFWVLCLLILVAALVPDFTIFAAKSINITVGHIFPGGAKFRNAFFLRRKRTVESTDL